MPHAELPDRLDSLLVRLRARLGEVIAPVASHPISESDIRRWAIAIHHPAPPPREFWDPDYARSLGYPGIVAPPEFNPFAWPADGVSRDTDPSLLRAMGSSVNGGTTMRHHAWMLPGDVITSVQTVDDVYERTGRSGRLVFMVVAWRWTNQRGELVRETRRTLIAS